MTPELRQRLAEMPDVLHRVAEALPASRHRRRPAGGGFSLVEHAWHLADLEREGYGVRLTRLLIEDGPHLPDFDGDRIARERGYQDDAIEPALTLFAHARRRNLDRLAALDEAALRRPGSQDGVGSLVLADVPPMMAAHDHGHLGELAALLAEIAPDLPVGGLVRERADAPAPAPGKRPIAA